MKVSCFALLALPALAAASAAFGAGSAVVNGDKTITKVVKLLQDMMKKSKEEDDTERTLYAKFKCYCDTNDAEKTDSIATHTKTIGLLESAIDSLQSQNGELSTETAQLKAAMAENEAARKEAKNVRDKANKAFLEEEKDLTAAIGQMEEAVKVLAAIGADQSLGAAADHEKFMAGKKNMGPLLVSLGADVKTALTAASIFLSPAQRKQMNSFLQGPFTGTYSSQSGQIVGILKDMTDTFKTNLESARASEKAEQEAFDKFTETKEDAFKAMETTFKEKEESLSSNDEALTSKKKQLQTSTKDKADAEEFLTKLTDMCTKKAEQYEDRKLQRANEQAAVAQAIAILNSDSAFETFGTVDATSTGKTKAASFLQVGQRRSDATLRHELEMALKVQKSTRLSRVWLMVEVGNPFKKVLTEIEKMIALNEEEGKQDKKNLDWCNSERKENKDNLKERKAEIVTLTGDIDQLKTTIDDPVKGLHQQITETEASLVQNDQAQKDETKQRTEENVAYQADVRNLVEAEDLLDKAIIILAKYYDGLAKRIADEKSLVQEDPAPPKTWDTFEGQSKSGNDAVSMLKFILSETKKEEMKAHTDEEKAQASYEDSMTELKKEQASSEESLVKLQENLATAQKSLIEKTEDLKDTEAAKVKIEDYLLKIKPGCDFITTNFDSREKNRKTEIDALKKAVTLIEASPAYTAAMEKAKLESFGKCKPDCSKDEAGAKCKACMADVTVPAYCAGHKGTKGC
jgi:chromosome segregation ATPase